MPECSLSLSVNCYAVMICCELTLTHSLQVIVCESLQIVLSLNCYWEHITHTTGKYVQLLCDYLFFYTVHCILHSFGLYLSL